MPDALRLGAIVVIAALGGMVNSIAGGGTLLTFPALIALGVSPLVANATSTVALWPGALGSLLGYRRRLAGTRRWAAVFAAPSVLGGAIGASLLLATPPDRFGRIVPWLVLGATALFAAQRPPAATVDRGPDESTTEPHVAPVPSHSAVALACQLLVGVYGGYFGAGIGILMLAVLGFMGFTDIHQMNGLKNWGGVCINLVAAAMFAASGIVDWAVALSMAIGATGGGYLASRLAQRVSQGVVRRVIVGVGVSSGLWLHWARLS
jgi:uncharacterized membrane protein YfcA